jgi:hypothetical protein
VKIVEICTWLTPNQLAIRPRRVFQSPLTGDSGKREVKKDGVEEFFQSPFAGDSEKREWKRYGVEKKFPRVP